MEKYKKQRRIICITVILPDKRVLSHRTGVDSEWEVTLEKSVECSDSLTVFNKTMWETFGVNTENYSDNFAEILRMAPINRLPEVFITPFLVSLKSSIAFESGINEFFQAIRAKDLLNDIMSNTVYPSNNKPKKHSQNAVHVLTQLHTRGVFK